MCSIKRENNSLILSSNNVILDIEGTTTSITFVKDILFPYVREHLEAFVKDNWNSENFQAILNALKIQAKEDKEKGLDGFIDIPEEGVKDDLLTSVIKNVLWQMDLDSKAKCLKDLQGLIMEEGYEKGELKGHVYEDVEDNLKLWTELGKTVYIYSSGSVHAQKLLFGHSEKGDMLEYIKGHFDTTVGKKTDTESYKKILELISGSPSETVFFTDVPKEARAAKEAGLLSVLLSREGNVPLTDEDEKEFHVITSFSEVQFENTVKKRKVCTKNDTNEDNKTVESCEISIKTPKEPINSTLSQQDYIKMEVEESSIEQKVSNSEETSDGMLKRELLENKSLHNKEITNKDDIEMKPINETEEEKTSEILESCNVEAQTNGILSNGDVVSGNINLDKLKMELSEHHDGNKKMNGNELSLCSDDSHGKKGPSVGNSESKNPVEEKQICEEKNSLEKNEDISVSNTNKKSDIQETTRDYAINANLTSQGEQSNAMLKPNEVGNESKQKKCVIQNESENEAVANKISEKKIIDTQDILDKAKDQYNCNLVNNLNSDANENNVSGENKTKTLFTNGDCSPTEKKTNPSENVLGVDAVKNNLLLLSEPNTDDKILNVQLDVNRSDEIKSDTNQENEIETNEAEVDASITNVRSKIKTAVVASSETLNEAKNVEGINESVKVEADEGHSQTKKDETEHEADHEPADESFDNKAKSKNVLGSTLNTNVDEGKNTCILDDTKSQLNIVDKVETLANEKVETAKQSNISCDDKAGEAITPADIKNDDDKVEISANNEDETAKQSNISCDDKAGEAITPADIKNDDDKVEISANNEDETAKQSNISCEDKAGEAITPADIKNDVNKDSNKLDLQEVSKTSSDEKVNGKKCPDSPTDDQKLKNDINDMKFCEVKKCEVEESPAITAVVEA